MKTAESTVSLSARDAAPRRALRAALLIAAGVCLLTLSAKFKVPYYPVPMTLQTLVVLLLPLAGGGAGAAAVAAYLALGAAGAPVFAGGGGLAYFAGPTGGFLLGFLPAAALAAFWHRRGGGAHFMMTAALLLGATALIFACGLVQLALILGDGQKALALGLYPFVIGEISKVTLAAAIAWLAHRAQANKAR